MMKILAMFSSPRGLASNSGFLLETILKEAEKKGHTVERLDLTKLDIRACTGCRVCWTNEEKACILDDDYHIVADAIADADYLFMATPLYYWWVSPALKLTLDRSYPPPFEKFAGKTMHMVITGEEPPENQCFVGIRDGFTAMCKYIGTNFKYFYTVADPFDKPAKKNAEAIEKAKALGASL
ncbi:MAG: flavodoxin family protein [Anaerovoracaceae bacterium]